LKSQAGDARSYRKPLEGRDSDRANSQRCAYGGQTICCDGASERRTISKYHTLRDPAQHDYEPIFRNGYRIIIPQEVRDCTLTYNCAQSVTGSMPPSSMLLARLRFYVSGSQKSAPLPHYQPRYNPLLASGTRNPSPVCFRVRAWESYDRTAWLCHECGFQSALILIFEAFVILGHPLCSQLTLQQNCQGKHQYFGCSLHPYGPAYASN
jgi:hypothetical protein